MYVVKIGSRIGLEESLDCQSKNIWWWWVSAKTAWQQTTNDHYQQSLSGAQCKNREKIYIVEMMDMIYLLVQYKVVFIL